MKTRMKVTAAALLVSLGLAACGGSGGSELSQEDVESLSGQSLYDAAQEEGQLVVYGPTEDLFQAVYEEFSTAFPGIDIQTQDIFGQELDAKLEGERASGGMTADLIHIAVPELERLRGQEFLATTLADGVEGLPTEFVGPDSQWLVSSLHLYAPMYNSDVVSAEDAPREWDDLLDFDGQFALSNPVSPGGQAQIFSAALEAEIISESWLQDLAAESPRVYPSIANASQAVVTAEADLSLVGGYGTFMRLAQEGAPVEMAFLKDGNYMTEVGYASVQEARHPAAAKLLATWILSEEGQQAIAEHVYEYGTMPGAPSPEGAPALVDVNRLDYPGQEKFQDTLSLLADLFGN